MGCAADCTLGEVLVRLVTMQMIVWIISHVTTAASYPNNLHKNIHFLPFLLVPLLQKAGLQFRIPFARVVDSGIYECGYQIEGEEQRSFVESAIDITVHGKSCFISSLETFLNLWWSNFLVISSSSISFFSQIWWMRFSSKHIVLWILLKKFIQK